MSKRAEPLGDTMCVRGIREDADWLAEYWGISRSEAVRAALVNQVELCSMTAEELVKAAREAAA